MDLLGYFKKEYLCVYHNVWSIYTCINTFSFPNCSHCNFLCMLSLPHITSHCPAFFSGKSNVNKPDSSCCCSDFIKTTAKAGSTFMGGQLSGHTDRPTLVSERYYYRICKVIYAKGHWPRTEGNGTIKQNSWLKAFWIYTPHFIWYNQCK